MRTYKNNYLYIIFFITITFLLIITTTLISPARLIELLFSVHIKNRVLVNGIFTKKVYGLYILCIICGLLALNFQRALKFFSFLIAAINKVKINYRRIIIVSFTILLLYLVILFILGCLNYDLGYDEVWYLSMAKCFSKNGFSFWISNGQIIDIGFFQMLPYNIVSSPLFYFNQFSTIYFKVLSSLIVICTMLFFCFQIKNKYTIEYFLVFIFFLIIQPGFGFVATSYFGEIPAALLLIIVFLYLGDTNNDENYHIVSISFFLALIFHIKFQLLPIVSVVLITFALRGKGNKWIKVLILSILFTSMLMIIRAIPSVIKDTINFIILAKSFYNLMGYQTSNSWLIILDRLSLFNKFIPLPLVLLVMTIAWKYLKTEGEELVITFVLVFFIYWILFFNFSTYRHIMLGIVPFAFIISIVVIRIFNENIKDSMMLRPIHKFLVYIPIILLFIYGASSNLIYAYIGNNDGVQFDITGEKSRIWIKPEHLTDQRDFYHYLQDNHFESELYSPSPHLAYCYLDKFIYSIDYFVKSSKIDGYAIISRTDFPIDLSEGVKFLKNNKLYYKLIKKIGGYELYYISKNVQYK